MNPACRRVEIVRPRGAIPEHNHALARSFAFLGIAQRQFKSQTNHWQFSMSKSLDGINIIEFDSNMGAAYATML
ncbi:MAG: hypothetical protein WA410_00685, partial [Candidatus Binatus sp.]